MAFKQFAIATAIACATALSGPAAAQTTDARPAILGVRIGMPQAEAIAALKAANPRLAFVSRSLATPSGGSFTYQIQAVAQASGQTNGEQITLMISAPSSGAKVVAVNRKWQAPVNQPAAWSAVVGALRAKHGKEVSWRANNGTNITGWFFDVNGRSSPAPVTYVRCTFLAVPSATALNFLMNYDASKMTDAELEMYTKASSPCGRWLYVSQSYLNGDLTNSFDVSLFDSQAYFKALRDISTIVNADAGAKQNSQEQNARQRGAPPM